jgi:hypothetical protein
MSDTAANNQAESINQLRNEENSGSAQQGKNSSTKKVEANRRNAQKSTGPKTERGKAKVRLNALKHGFLAEQVLLFACSEDRSLFATLMDALWQHFQPLGALEGIQVQQMGICLWKERKGLRWEIAQQQAASWFVPVPRSVVEGKVEEREPEPTPRQILLGEKMPDADQVDLIIRYQAANDRRFHRASIHLERLQRMRKGEYVPAPVSVAGEGTVTSAIED